MSLFQKVFGLCPPELKKKFWILLAAMLVLAFGETATVGLIAFYAAAVSDPQSSWQAVVSHPAYKILPLSIHPFIASPKALIGTLSILVIVAVLLKNIYRGAVTFHTARYGALIEAFFGQHLLENFLYRNYLWHLKKNSADLIQLVQWRTFLGRGFLTPCLNIFCELAMLSVLLVALISVQPLVSVLFIGIQGGAGFIIYRLLRKGLDKSANACQQCSVEMNRRVTRALHGIKDVKITNTTDFFLNGFTKQANIFARMFGLERFWHESPLLTLETLGFILIAGAILFMLFGLGYSPLETTGTTALLAVTAWRTLPAFNRVVASLADIRGSRPYIQSLLDALSGSKDTHPCTMPLKEAGHPAISFQKKIQFKDVTFSYDNTPPVIHSLNLTIHKGQSLGIMGPSGCGKSTLVDLLSGLLIPTRGEILIDGVRLTRNNIRQWRRLIGYVPQFPYIFHGTLAENIAFGKEKDEIDRELVLKVIRMASIDFLDRLPKGIDTNIGERGVKLSGGQRQRVAIARALYRRPEIIIFDEATSALDEKNDRQIRQLISTLKGEQTLVVVSHRISTVQDSDHIFHMK